MTRTMFADPPARAARCLTTALAVAAGLLLAAPATAQLPSPAASQAPASSPAADALHAPFDRLLRAHVRAGAVDYAALAAAPELPAYLRALARTDPAALPPADRLALWINAYNAYTIALIVERGERRSIRRIGRVLGIRTNGAWREPIAVVGGRRYTLDAIEHEVIRRRFAEPRIHFALVCAARSCPVLRAEAYAGARLDRQLDEQTRRFLRETPAQNRVDVAARTATLSRIFEWYAADFGGDPAAVQRWVAPYLDGAARDLLARGEARLGYADYDWALNASRPPPAGGARVLP